MFLAPLSILRGGIKGAVRGVIQNGFIGANEAVMKTHFGWPPGGGGELRFPLLKVSGST